MWKQIKGVAAVLLQTVGLIPELCQQLLTWQEISSWYLRKGALDS